MTLDELLLANVYHSERIANALDRFTKGDTDMTNEASVLWEYSKAVEKSGIKYTDYLAVNLREISRALRSLSRNQNVRNVAKQRNRIEEAVSNAERTLRKIVEESEVS